MIAQFHQSQAHPVCEYVITDLEGKPLGTAENADGQGDTLVQNAILRLPDGEYRIHITLRKSVGSDGTLQQRFPIFLNEKEIGAIEQRSTVKKVRFLKYEGYKYQTFPVGGEEFELCEVGFGAGQHYFCIHRNGVTAAVVHMSDEEQTFCNDYMIYAEDEKAFAAACIGIMYKEAVCYNNRDTDYFRSFSQREITKNSVFNTPDASLRARFDPNFIPRIQARDGRN